LSEYASSSIDPPRPNVILILADESRADALSCFGNPVCRTPHLDALAASGTQFNQCMITCPTCTPSRASILSGCFPSAIRSRMVGCVTPDDPRLLPRVLGKAGFDTVSIGKIHLSPCYTNSLNMWHAVSICPTAVFKCHVHPFPNGIL
jgi:arylsulfatase A-like enzyme